MRRRLLPAALATIVLAVGAWVALAPSATAASSVTIGLRSFAISKSVSSVPHGTVTFKLVNKGKLMHDFKISGKKSKLISPGKSGRLIVTLKKGKLSYLCTVAGHAAAGMKGKLTVT